jgi:hypothetical protein
MSEFRAKKNDLHNTPSVYCVRMYASYISQNVVNLNDVMKQDRIVIFSQHMTRDDLFLNIVRRFIDGIIKQLNTHPSANMVK